MPELEAPGSFGWSTGPRAMEWVVRTAAAFQGGASCYAANPVDLEVSLKWQVPCNCLLWLILQLKAQRRHAAGGFVVVLVEGAWG